MEQLERLPVRNDSWSSGAVRMRVVEMAGRTVQTVDIFLDSGDKA